MPNRVPRPIAALVALLAVMLLAGCAGAGSDDPPASVSSPPVTSGPLAGGEPEMLVLRAVRQLTSGSYRANALTSVRLSPEGTDPPARAAGRRLETERDARIEVESPRRRSLLLLVGSGASERLVSVVAYDGAASLSVDGGVVRPLAPELVAAVGDAGRGDADRLAEALGEVADLGDGERTGGQVRVYEAPLDAAYLSRVAAGAIPEGATLSEATARFELRRSDGGLALHGLYARAERTLPQGRVATSVSLELFPTEQGASIRIEEPMPTGRPIATQGELAAVLRE